MDSIKEPRHEDIRAARAFADKTASGELPPEFRGGDELGTRPVEAVQVRTGDRKALEAEAWYRDYMKLKAAQSV